MVKKLSVIHIASEVDPFSKTGGLGDVARSLPKAIKRNGHTVAVITPFYEQIVDPKKHKLKKIKKSLKVELSKGKHIVIDVWEGKLIENLPVYFIENTKYFGKRKSLYGSKWENARFMVFDLSCLTLIKELNIKPDIIHCHDWQSGLVPYFLKGRFKNDKYWKNTATLFTIHNLLFQFGHAWWKIQSDQKDDGYSPLPTFGHKEKLEKINFAKRAIINTDLISTVSEQYAKEIMTKDFGEDLQRLLKNRERKLFGIVNGIDYKDYNPLTDPGLHTNYDYHTLRRKLINKRYLQKLYGLPKKDNVPIIGMVTRITEQKGFDLLIPIFENILERDVQFVIMGSGEKHYENFFRQMAKKYPKKVAAKLTFDAKHATGVYAASDLFLMPSRFEPCGLGQLISLRYGSIPIVRAVGGLADTVSDFNPATGKGNGFVFKKYSPTSLLIAIIRALETYKYTDKWKKMMFDGMKQSYSWEIPAQKYIQLYKKAIHERAKK